MEGTAAYILTIFLVMPLFYFFPLIYSKTRLQVKCVSNTPVMAKVMKKRWHFLYIPSLMTSENSVFFPFFLFYPYGFDGWVLSLDSEPNCIPKTVFCFLPIHLFPPLCSHIPLLLWCVIFQSSNYKACGFSSYSQEVFISASQVIVLPQSPWSRPETLATKRQH